MRSRHEPGQFWIRCNDWPARCIGAVMHRLLWLGCWIALTGCGSTPWHARESWGPRNGNLQMSLASSERPPTQDPYLAITLRNVGPDAVHLNLGTRIPRFESPVRIQLTVVDGQGKAFEYGFVDTRYAGVAGGLSDFIVLLNPQQRYTLDLALKQFWFRDMTGHAAELHGTLQLTAHLPGCEADVITQNCLIGELRSNTLRLRL